MRYVKLELVHVQVIEEDSQIVCLLGIKKERDGGSMTKNKCRK